MASDLAVPQNAGSSSNGKTKSNNFLLSLINDFGGPLAIVTATESILNFASKLSTNQKYQKVIGGLKMTLPAVVIGYKMYDSVKTYYENKCNTNVSENKTHKILKLLKIDIFDYRNLEGNLMVDSFKLGSEVTHWILRSPKTDKFSIEGYYDDNFNPTQTINFEKGTSYIVFKKESVRFVLELELLGFLNNKLFVLNSNMWYLYTNDNEGMLSDLKKRILIDFIDNFNTKENTIIYNATGIDVRTKIKVGHEINQFDVYKLAEEIKSVIDKKRKRGYIFAGVPGTGKSSILLKLESLLSGIPILYVSKSSIGYNGNMNEVFSLINTLSPCVAIFEDLDCFGFVNKESRAFNEFLQEIDNVYEKYNTVIIATLNDSSQVHHSLINRPGRFDQVFLINPPQTNNEVYAVMTNRYTKITQKEFMPIESIDVKLMNRIIENHFTQADICEIIEKLLINDMEINNNSLEFSIQELENSKKAIKACNFHNQNNNNTDEEDAENW